MNKDTKSINLKKKYALIEKEYSYEYGFSSKIVLESIFKTDVDIIKKKI